MGRFKAKLLLTANEEAQLRDYVRARATSPTLAERAGIILACASGEGNNAVARRLSFTSATVGKWRTRFINDRVAGLRDQVRSGRPRKLGDERLADLFRSASRKSPEDARTPWSLRRAAKENGVSKSSVHRYLQLFHNKTRVTRTAASKTSVRSSSRSRNQARHAAKPRI